MQVKFDIKYERSKKKVAKRIDIEKVEKTEKLFKSDPTHYQLELKSIVCRRDKHKK